MKQDTKPLVPWTATSLPMAIGVAIVCCVAAIALAEWGRWPGFAGSELIVSALAGGAVLWVYHRQAPGMILFVFVPLMTLLLFFGAFAVGILMGDFELGRSVTRDASTRAEGQFVAVADENDATRIRRGIAGGTNVGKHGPGEHTYSMVSAVSQ